METTHRTQHLINHGLTSLVSPLMQILRLVRNKTNKQNPLVNSRKLWCSHKIINKITRALWVIFSTLPLKIMTNSRIYREEGRTGVMILVPSSNSWLNNASLASSYLSLMFCAFPKSLSKRSGLGLRVTSNDNLFAVICVYKQPKTFRTPVQHFLKTNQSFKKLRFLKQLFLSKNRGIIPKRRATLPAPQFNMQNRRLALSQWQNGLKQGHISWAVQFQDSTTLYSGDTDKMVHANELTKVKSCAN